MSKRHPNPRLVKIHRSYTVEETAAVCSVHRNTVRQWIKTGLPTLDNRRPVLMQGGDLRAFLEGRRNQNKRPCLPGQMYCLRCRTPQHPAGDMADYEALTATQGNLVGICPSCDLIMNRRVNFAKLLEVAGNLNVTLPHALLHIDERTKPCVNSDLA
ncbi:hypothetical protein BH11PSE7_BH11PSE7_00110 [soil metagenome]